MMTFQTCIEEDRRKDKLLFREIISEVPFVSRVTMASQMTTQKPRRVCSSVKDI